MTQTKRAEKAAEEAMRRSPTAFSPAEIQLELNDALVVTATARRWLEGSPRYINNAKHLAAADPLLLYCWEECTQFTSNTLFQGDSDGYREPLIPLYEELLARRDPRHRRRAGVYGTPWSLARFMMRSINQALIEDCGLKRGFAEDDPGIRFWDPAAGSGIFAAAAVWQVKESVDYTAESIAGWHELVTQRFLPRFTTDELRLAPWVLSHWVLATSLAHIDIDLIAPLEVPFRWSDALAAPDLRADPSTRLAVVVGNPPYGSLALPGHEWMDKLLRGVDFDGTPRANYHAVDGQPLGERKTWLQDDYVKFLRRAHVEVERAGQGIVCFVTNHGYLDNPTFRGLRRALQLTFPSISLVDLHGNATRREKTPAGKADQNIFGIETGVAVGLFSSAGSAEIRRGDLWGSVEEKVDVLMDETVQSLATIRCPPLPPDYAFVPPRDDHREYDAGLPLHELMPLASSAIVTARDRLAIAFSREELIARLEELRDPAISDDEIRARYLRSRSPRHAEGNTRGWDLAAARAALRADSDWRAPIIECLYRPFDYRAIYYSSLLVDWPRRRVMEQLINPPQRPDALALIARRQMPAGQPCNYFWATDRPVVDGVIRSDNRGNETIFPLYDIDAAGERRANFAPGLVARFAKLLDCRWIDFDASDMQSTFGAYDLMSYIYGLFWTPTYQSRYADALRIHFPRVLLPRSREVFARVSRYGSRLLQAHTQGKPSPTSENAEGSIEPGFIEPGFPMYQEGNVEIASGAALARTSPEVWNFRAGAHQVARKWLKDRRGANLKESDRANYRNTLAAIAATLRIQEKLEAAIADLGGFPGAFEST